MIVVLNFEYHIINFHNPGLNLLGKIHLEFVLVRENDVHALVVIMVGYQEEIIFPRIDVVSDFTNELRQSLDVLGAFRVFSGLSNIRIGTTPCHLTCALIYCLTVVAIDLVILQYVVVLSVDQNDFGKVAVDLTIQISVVIFEVCNCSQFILKRSSLKSGIAYFFEHPFLLVLKVIDIKYVHHLLAYLLARHLTSIRLCYSVLIIAARFYRSNSSIK